MHHLRKFLKKNYGKQFTTVTTHKNVQNYCNGKCTYNVIIHRNLFAIICTKNMELELYSKEKAIFSFLNQVAI